MQRRRLSASRRDLAAPVRAPSPFCTMPLTRANAAPPPLAPAPPPKSEFLFLGSTTVGVQYPPALLFVGPSYGGIFTRIRGFSPLRSIGARGGKLEDAGLLVLPARDEVHDTDPSNGWFFFFGDGDTLLPAGVFSMVSVCTTGTPTVSSSNLPLAS